MNFARLVLSLTLAMLAVSCRDSRPFDDGLAPDAAPADARPSDGLRDDLVAAVGSDRTLDIATWNLENFPKRAFTAALTADLIASLRLDLVALQEVADVEAFEELVERLPDHEGMLSEHVYPSGTFQKIGIVYRADLLAIRASTLLFAGDSYPFPRPPLQVEFAVIGRDDVDLDFVAIAVHLKAGTSSADADRRRLAFESLEQHMRTLVDGGGDDEVIFLGDFNETLDSDTTQQVWSPIVAAPEHYRVHTQTASDNHEYSFLPGDRLLDHIVTTAALDDELAGRDARIPRIDSEITDYEGSVSDHLPVVLSMPIFQPPGAAP